MPAGKLRWGILSTAQIGRKNWKAIRHSGNGTVVALASRDLRRAQQWLDERQADSPMDAMPRALGSYEELLAAPEVDAVYIPLPTGLRKEWVLRAAAAGKHVVCEKPCAESAGDLVEMIEACRRNRVQFMDGVMFMHSARLARMREVLDDAASVGEIRRITSSFSFCAPPVFFAENIRAHDELEPHGCLGDLGWYCIRFALWAMNWRMPVSATGRVLQSVTAPGARTAVPTEFSGELLFENGVSSGFYCSFVTANEQCAHVSGTKGYLRLADFVVPFPGSELAFEVNNTVPNASPQWRCFTVPEHGSDHPTAQAANMFRNFAAQVRSRALNESWPELALKTQRVLEMCSESARVNSK